MADVIQYLGNIRGPQGYSVASAVIGVDDHLRLVLSNGAVLDTGVARGPQGLPGVNATPADEAVAGYISTQGTSATKSALVATLSATFVKSSNVPAPAQLSGLSPNNGIRTVKSSSPVLDVVGSMPENILKVGDTYWLLYSQAYGGVIKLCLASAAFPDGPWTPFGSNPVLSIGAEGWEVDGASTNGGSLMQRDGVFYLYYAQDAPTTGTPTIGVATATSVTGPYTKFNGNPLLPLGAAGEWDSLRIQEPHVIVGPDGTWIMAYMAEASTSAKGTTERIGIATSPGPFGPWTKAPGNPLIEYGTTGIWDKGGAADPSLFYENGFYWCLYSGLALGGAKPWQLGLAFATNPSGPWIRHESNPIVAVGAAGAFDSTGVWRGAIYREGLDYYLPYGGIPDPGSSSFAKGGSARLVIQDAVARGAAITAKVNLSTNPSRETDLVNVLVSAGAGASATLSNPMSGGKRGSGFARATWNVGSSAAGNGVYDLIPNLIAAKTYSGGVWVRSSISNRLQFRLVWLNAAGASIGTIPVGAETSAAAGVWTRLTLENVFSPPGTAKAYVEAWTVAGGNYANWAPGDTLDSDSVMFNVGPTVFDDFDGSFAASGDTTYAWSGSANASTSFGTSRPPAAAMAIGTVGFDPRLGKPVWSTGAAWVDATGTVV
jgi:hypothetical protein